MTSLIRRTLMLAACWALLGISTTAPAKPIARQTYYYWYYYDNDQFLWFEPTSNAITDLENLTGLLVNTNNFGGTIVAKGYNNNTYPHNSPAAVILYTH